MNAPVPKDYATLLTDIKARIRSAHYEALKAVNKELIALYWDIGRIIVERQKGQTWGKAVVERLAADIQKGIPNVSGRYVDLLSETTWSGYAGAGEVWLYQRVRAGTVFLIR